MKPKANGTVGGKRVEATGLLLTMPLYLREAWKSAWHSARTTQAAQLLWDLHLSDHEKRRLGGDFNKVGLDARRMWQKVRGGSDPQAAIAVAVLIGSLTPACGKAILAHFGDTPADDRTTLSAAVRNGGLVLVEGLRQAHWERALVAVDWTKSSRPWCFLFDLALRARTGSSLDALGFLGQAAVKLSSMANIRYRLVNHPGFPADLAARIKPSGAKEYKLDLGGLPLRIFSEGSEGKVTELPPG